RRPAGARNRAPSLQRGEFLIRKGAKLGRSVGYSRRASSTGITTAAGLSYLAIVVASPRSAASTTAEREALGSRKRGILTLRSPPQYHQLLDLGDRLGGVKVIGSC